MRDIELYRALQSLIPSCAHLPEADANIVFE
jgi:hypothetical protein